MSKRKIEFSKDEYYHLYNRGCNREKIFFEAENYIYLLQLVKRQATQNKVAVIAYCLMPNHYHFLVRQDSNCSIADFMQVIFNTYTKAINKRYNRTGTLFEGPFKAKHVNNFDYLLHLCRYIHRNPFEAKLHSDLEGWYYSNYLDWIGLRNGELIGIDFDKNNFRNAREYKMFVTEYEPSLKDRVNLKPFLFE